MQRLRMALPYFTENGWEVTVAAAPDDQHSAPRDPLLLSTVPQGTRVIHPKTWAEASCRRFGFGHLSYRTGIPWRGEVRKLLAMEKFDLVFFTTTQTMVLANGPHWRRASGVPYVIDIQDPIHNPGGVYTKANAPGAYWKYCLSQQISRWIEKSAFRRVSGVVSTSPHYLETLRDRYPHLAKVPMETLPFAFPEQDLALLGKLGVKNRIFPKNDGAKVILYAGRGGPDLHAAMKALFQALAHLKVNHPHSDFRVKMYFVGTSYGPEGAPRQVEPLAKECGCAESVCEEPERRPYFEVLQASREADAVLVLGSRSADYTASKALLAMAAARRVIAVVHRDSLVHRLFEARAQVALCAFRNTPEEPECVASIAKALREVATETGPIPARAEIPAEYSAREMTRKLCELFDSALGGGVSRLEMGRR